MTITALAIAGLTHATRSTWFPDRKNASHSPVLPCDSRLIALATSIGVCFDRVDGEVRRTCPVTMVWYVSARRFHRVPPVVVVLPLSAILANGCRQSDAAQTVDRDGAIPHARVEEVLPRDVVGASKNGLRPAPHEDPAIRGSRGRRVPEPLERHDGFRSQFADRGAPHEVKILQTLVSVEQAVVGLAVRPRVHVTLGVDVVEHALWQNDMLGVDVAPWCSEVFQQVEPDVASVRTLVKLAPLVVRRSLAQTLLGTDDQAGRLDNRVRKQERVASGENVGQSFRELLAKEKRNNRCEPALGSGVVPTRERRVALEHAHAIDGEAQGIELSNVIPERAVASEAGASVASVNCDLGRNNRRTCGERWIHTGVAGVGVNHTTAATRVIWAKIARDRGNPIEFGISLKPGPNGTTPSRLRAWSVSED